MNAPSTFTKRLGPQRAMNSRSWGWCDTALKRLEPNASSSTGERRCFSSRIFSTSSATFMKMPREVVGKNGLVRLERSSVARSVCSALVWQRNEKHSLWATASCA